MMVVRPDSFSVLWLLLSVSAGAASVIKQSQQPLRAPYDGGAIFDSDFDAFVEATLWMWHVPGLSIAVIDNGQIYSKGYGHAHLPDESATADTQYFTGSTTKAFTAAAAALLVHDNDKYPEVQWKSPISHFIPADFAMEDEHASTHTTIEDALSHRTGLPRHDSMYGQRNDTLSSVVQRLRYLPMTAEPRTLFQYCNLMFGVIADLLETVTGLKLEKFLVDNIWTPLGMRSTTFTTSSASNLARGYWWNSENSTYVPEPYIDISPISGAGSTISTVNDYALWIKALLDASDSSSSSNTSNPISNRLFRDLVTPRTIVTEAHIADGNDFEFITPPYYALGWITFNFFRESLFAHDGGLNGFGTTLYMLPSKGWGMVTMANTAETSNIAGSIIAARLLLEKLDASSAPDCTVSSFGESLLEVSETSRGRRSLFSKRQKSQPDSLTQQMLSESTSRQHRLSRFAGFYSHPAYGTVNITTNTNRLASTSPENVLEVSFYPRTWPMLLQLVPFQDTDNIFIVNVFEPHGLGDVTTGEDIVWEYLQGDDPYAVFDFGLDGHTVERVGIQLEEEMVEMAEAKGEKYWRESMIWFDNL